MSTRQMIGAVSTSGEVRVGYADTPWAEWFVVGQVRGCGQHTQIVQLNDERRHLDAPQEEGEYCSWVEWMCRPYLYPSVAHKDLTPHEIAIRL